MLVSTGCYKNTDRETLTLPERGDEEFRKFFPEEIMELNSGGLKGISQFMKWERAPKKRDKFARHPRFGESRVGRENDRGLYD